MGLPGDDHLVGPAAVHGLVDAFRLHLEQHPPELERIVAARPDGPPAVSYRTRGAGRNPYRYDAIWVSSHFEVDHVEYLYEEAIAVGTDHALVLADLVLCERPVRTEEST